MALSKITVANFFAKYSCPKWQKNRTIRHLCRKFYRYIMEKNTAEYPYADKNFAGWEMSDEDGNYSLVSDSHNFVIRQSPSYFAWLIEQRLGRRLVLPAPGNRQPGEHVFDAKHWGEVLEYNGIEPLNNIKIDEVRSEFIGTTTTIGVVADEGTYGQLLLLDRIDDNGVYIAKVYENGEFVDRPVSCEDKTITWYFNPVVVAKKQ